MILVLGALCLVALGIRLAYVWYGEIAYDEYQHMHAAYLISQGQTPFVDFFEHHTPLFYYFAAAVIPMRSPSFDTMIHARYLALSFHVLTIVLAALWVRRLAGHAEALVVTVLLTANLCLFVWGTRSYLDTYAAALLVLSASTLAVDGKRPLRCFLSGAALALAVLVTQKAVLAALAPAVVFLARAPREWTDASQRRAWSADLGAFTAGGLVAALLLPALLGIRGVEGLVRDAIVLNLHWKARHFPWRELRLLFASDAFVYVTALCGVSVGVRQLVRRGFRIEESDVAALFLLSLALGVFVIPVVWEEYFILLLPFAAIVAGTTLVRWWQSYAMAPLRPHAAIIVAIFVAASVIDLVALRFVSNNPISPAAFLAAPVLWIVVATLIVAARRRGAPREALLWIALVVVLPVLEQMDWTPRHRNDGDRARVDYVMATTTPSDPVFDGRSGFGVFRPHAYRFWFLHDEMQLMLTEEQKGPDIIRALDRQKVPVAIVDDFVRMLPKSVLEYITTHYTDTPFPDIKRRLPDLAER